MKLPLLFLFIFTRGVHWAADNPLTGPIPVAPGPRPTIGWILLIRFYFGLSDSRRWELHDLGCS